MDIDNFLRSRCGAATTSTLMTAGFTRRMLAKAVRDGVVNRLHRGVYTSRASDHDVVAAFRADGSGNPGLGLPRADSLLEVLAHTHFTRAGLKVQVHVDIPGVGEVDCLLNECLIVELDGGTHLEGKQVKKDQYRNNAAMRRGLLTLHYYYVDVVHHPERMVAEVMAVLRNREVGLYAPARYAPEWVPPS